MINHTKSDTNLNSTISNEKRERVLSSEWLNNAQTHESYN